MNNFVLIDEVQMCDGFEKTIYSSCCNVDKGIYYYTTYENRHTQCINIYDADIDGEKLLVYQLANKMGHK